MKDKRYAICAISEEKVTVLKTHLEASIQKHVKICYNLAEKTKQKQKTVLLSPTISTLPGPQDEQGISNFFSLTPNHHPLPISVSRLSQALFGTHGFAHHHHPPPKKKIRAKTRTVICNLIKPKENKRNLRHTLVAASLLSRWNLVILWSISFNSSWIFCPCFCKSRCSPTFPPMAYLHRNKYTVSL